MSLLNELKEFVGSWPGGYKQMERGTQGRWEPPPFQQPTDPRDRRSRIPALGHKEYWYPALPANDVGWKKPSVLRMLGEDLVFFHGEDGEVKALEDVCPHRGVYLSFGDSFYKGFLTCKYHGATYDGEGNCVAFISEGPDSQAVGKLKARAYPTVTLLGMVFVWMGVGEPVDPKEDIPPEMFEPNNIHRPTFVMFPCNWILTLENTNDSHVSFVHRNAITILFGGGKAISSPRTPFGNRTQIIDDHAVWYKNDGTKPRVDRYYYDENGDIPYQMYYPGVKGVWPLHRWRLLWTWIADRKRKRNRENQAAQLNTVQNEANRWNGTCLPGMSRTAGANPNFRDTRWPVPVEASLTRMIYLNVERYSSPPNPWTRFTSHITWPVRNFVKNFNFRSQDIYAEMTGQYDKPEFLLSTDTFVIATRRLLADYARGVKPSEPELAVQDVGELNAQEVEQQVLEIAETRKSSNVEEIKEKILERP